MADFEEKKPSKKPVKRVKKHQSAVNDGGAKKGVLTGYHLFLRDRVAKIKEESPGLPPREYLQKAIGSWKFLPDAEKEVFNEQSRKENDRRASLKEIVEGKNGLKEKRIPIFTQSFILHNREREKEFRRLQKQAAEVQQQSALLSAHSDSLRTAINRLEGELDLQRNRSTLMSTQKEKARAKVIEAFEDISSAIADNPIEADSFRDLSTEELLSAFSGFIADIVPSLSEEQHEYIKLALIGILDQITEMSISPQPAS